MCGAGQPPLLRRGDEATTPSEKAAVRGSNIVVRTSEVLLRLPGVGVARSPLKKSRLRYQVKFAME